MVTGPREGRRQAIAVSIIFLIVCFVAWPFLSDYLLQTTTYCSKKIQSPAVASSTQHLAFLSNLQKTSFGLYLGSKTSDMRPVDLLGYPGIAAWPIANPVVSPRTTLSINTISAPHLSYHDGTLYLLFESTLCRKREHVIHMAKSHDEGLSWTLIDFPHLSSYGGSNKSTDKNKHKGIDQFTSKPSPSSLLHYPSVFHDTNSTDAHLLFTTSQHTLLYTLFNADTHGWSYKSTLLDIPLLNPSMWYDNGLSSWVLTGSVPIRGRMTAAGASSYEDHAVAVYLSSSMTGPFIEHSFSPFKVEGGSPAGGVSILHEHKKQQLIRTGRTCHRGLCGDVKAFSLSISSTSLKQKRLEGVFEDKLWKQPSAWDSQRRAAASLVSLPSGNTVAILAGESYGPQRPSIAVVLQIFLISIKAMAMATSLIAIGHIIARFPTVQYSLLRTWYSDCEGMEMVSRGIGASGQLGKAKSSGPDLSASRGYGSISKATIHDRPSPFASSMLVNRRIAASPSSHNDRHSRDGSSTEDSSSNFTAKRRGAAAARQWFSNIAQTRARRSIAVILLALASVTAAVVLHKVDGVVNPFWSPALPHAIGGQYSRFTLMVMSYEKRKKLLNWYIMHYSQCPSVGEILIVWNAGEPPVAGTDYPAGPAVPVRVRIETTNSMNNRYKPDSKIKYRGVLSLDDDILIPCSDIERAFGSWRENPALLVGFYPRLVEEAVIPNRGDILRMWKYRGEPAAVQRSRYNMILSGGAFIDSDTLFALYWSKDLEKARSLVDQVQNCDDILMNFVVANATLPATVTAAEVRGNKMQLPPAIRYVRPARRVDVSWASGVGLSHAIQHFIEDADLCLGKFFEIFGGVPLRTEAFDWAGDHVPKCDATKDILQCSFLSR